MFGISLFGDHFVLGVISLGVICLLPYLLCIFAHFPLSCPCLLLSRLFLPVVSQFTSRLFRCLPQKGWENFSQTVPFAISPFLPPTPFPFSPHSSSLPLFRDLEFQPSLTCRAPTSVFFDTGCLFFNTRPERVSSWRSDDALSLPRSLFSLFSSSRVQRELPLRKVRADLPSDLWQYSILTHQSILCEDTSPDSVEAILSIVGAFAALIIYSRALQNFKVFIRLVILH